MAEIYLIEDDLGLARTIQIYLSKSGYSIQFTNNAKSALDHLKFQGKGIDLVILDLILVNSTGFLICEEIRKLKLSCGIIILSQIADPDNIIKALNTGADDYLTKPFMLPELLARVKATLRRTVSYQPTTLKLNGLEINYDMREVYFKGILLKLRKKEFELLYYLAKQANLVLNRDQILLNVWGQDNDAYPNTVDVHIRQLRKKFAEVNPVNAIQTIHGVGYKLKLT